MLMPVKKRLPLVQWIAFSACLLLIFQQAPAQSADLPDSQELLNGLRVLIWTKPGNPEVVVKLRIHSGSAFDLAGKSGEMALLGDILFPDPATADYFTDQMGGKLNVSVNYDSMTITMRGKAEQVRHRRRPDAGRGATEQRPAGDVTAVVGERIHEHFHL